MKDDSDDRYSNEVTDTGHFLRPRSVLIILLIAIAAPAVALAGYALYRSYFEISAPLIYVSEIPRGIGLTPVSFKLRADDADTGLKEISITVDQKGHSKEIFRKQFKTEKTFSQEIEINGEALELDDSKGPLSVDVRAVDRSIWANTAHSRMVFNVDFRKPQVEILAAAPAVRRGGSQIIFYKAIDENLAVSGVHVGSKIFLGDRASGFDKAFDDRSLFVVIYALPVGETRASVPVKVFAEDVVGNANSSSFDLKIQERTESTEDVSLGYDFMRGAVQTLAEQNLAQVQAVSRNEGNEFNFKSTRGGDERLVEQFAMVQDPLRRINENELQSALRVPRSETYFHQPFVSPGGKALLSFGDKVRYLFEGKVLTDYTLEGFELSPGKFEQEVVAPNDGIVVLSDNLGIYGRVVVIDHGLGVMSVCGRLEQAMVSKGDLVSRGQRIGIAGKSGFARVPQVYFEMRVQGVPVDGLDWSDGQWFYGNFMVRSDEAKRKLGLPVYKPF